MDLKDLLRKCNNCIYFPCLKQECGNMCKYHTFEHEEMIKRINNKLKGV